MPISRNPLSGRNLYRHLRRVKHLRSVKGLLSVDLVPRGVRYESNPSPALRTFLTITIYRQRSPSHPQLRPSLRINASPATTMDLSGRSSNAKNAASRPTQERLGSPPNRWKWIIGYAKSVRTINCKRRRWIRLVCFVQKSGMILRTGFIHLRRRSCVRRSLRRDRDGCMWFVRCSYRSSRSAIPRGYGWLRVSA